MLNYAIIIPTYNRAQSLATALDSLRNQDVNLEVIVIDDGSDDNTKEVVANFYQYLDIQYIYQKNQGVSNARNTGLKHVSNKADYLIFLDSDDFFNSDALKQMDKYLQIHDVNIAVMNMQIHTETEAKMVKLDKFKLDYISIHDETMAPHYYIGGTAIATKVIKKYKLKFDEDIDYFEDAIFINKIILHEGGYGIVRDAIYNYVQGEENPTKTKKRFNDVFNKAYPTLIKYVKDHDLSLDYLSYAIFYNQRFSCSYQYVSTLNKEGLKIYQEKLQTLVSSLNLAMLDKLVPNDYRKKVLSFLIYDDPQYLKHKLRKIKVTSTQRTPRGFIVDVQFMKTCPGDGQDLVFKSLNKQIKPFKEKALGETRQMQINGIDLMYPTLYLYRYRISLPRYVASVITYHRFQIFYNNKKVLEGRF